MARELDAFVDALLDDALRRREAERDFDPAADRNECQQTWIRRGQPRACARWGLYARRVGAQPTQDQRTRLAQLRGRCREQQFVQQMCLGRITTDPRGRLQRLPRSRWLATTAPGIAGNDLRHQVRAWPGSRRSPVVDAIVIQGPGQGAGYEHKSMALRAAMADPRGRLTPQAAQWLRQRVLEHSHQVHRQTNWARRPGGQALVPPQVDLVYTLDGLGALPALAQRQVLSLIEQQSQRAGVRTHVLGGRPDRFADEHAWDEFE
jgi:hypothetical protein